MKNLYLPWLLLTLTLSACGQPGALYLPGQKPPFYVEPNSPEPEAKDKENKTDAPTPQERKQPETSQ
jgi:predicted small lipoprotein YifL